MDQCSHQVWKMAQEIMETNRDRHPHDVKDAASEKVYMTMHPAQTEAAQYPKGGWLSATCGHALGLLGQHS